MLTAYALFVMTPYLINVWKLNIARAAAIVNVFSGVATIMPIGMAFLVDAFMGDYWMLLLSSLAYSFVGFQNFPHFFCVYTMLQVLPILLFKSALVILFHQEPYTPITLPGLGLQIPLPTFCNNVERIIKEQHWASHLNKLLENR